jgi:hypothetical protein
MLFLFAACTGSEPDEAAEPATQPAAVASPPEAAPDPERLACTPQRPPAARPSPYDSVTISIGQRQAKICYSRPFARGRMVFDSLVPYGRIWRTGANEPTTLHIPFAADIAGIAVEPGSYSIYTIPTATDWTVVVNRSTSQWGIESRYTAEVEAQEVGRATVPSERLPELVEQFTIRSEPAGDDAANLTLEWVHTRVVIPITSR